MKRITLLAGSFLIGNALFASSFPLPPTGDDLIGQITYAHAQEGEKIYNIAEQYDMGFYELVEANPSIPRHSEISPDEKLIIPDEFILPDVTREGIVVNLPELRLYYYPPGENTVITYPLAIGRYEWITPTITTKVIDKQKNPYWHVPKSIKAEAAKKGIYWDDVVPPGPKNPLGKYALRLGERSYLIHGTINPQSIGKRASSGCMRMYPSDIEALFSMVSVDTPVRIVNEWYKMGWKDGKLYLEMHEPLQETAQPRRIEKTQLDEAITQIAQKYNAQIDWQTVDAVFANQNGIPTVIGSLQTTASSEPTSSSDNVLPH